MTEPIRIRLEKLTREYVHIDELGSKTKLSGLPNRASIKAVKARAKAMGLKVDREVK